MGLHFDHPWVLLLLLPLMFLWIWSFRRNIRLSGYRKFIAWTLRTMMILLLILALSGMQWFKTVKKQNILFVVDRSDSIKAEGQIIEWMREAASSKKEMDEVGVVSLGLNAVVERNPSPRSLDRFEMNTKVNSQFTNLASGLQIAESMVTPDATSRIVLISDGEENVGDVLKQGRLLRDKGIAVDVLAVPRVSSVDVAIEQFTVPERLHQGEKYTLELVVQSTVSTSGILRIFEDNEEISSAEVQIERGENHFALQSIAKDPGFHRYRAEIYVDEDTQSINNAGYTFSRVIGPPKVLVVEGKQGESHNITSMLEAALIPYDLIIPEMLFNGPEKYTMYESIIFNNVSATSLSETKMKWIEQAVRDFGVGFVMIGGEESYGLGGYFHTPIERALPVYMDLRGKRQIPSLGLILVIDKSSSMSDGKIELAKEAAIRTVELLRDQDTIGVVAFDSSPWWVVKPQRLSNRDEIIKQISGIQASGGTEIYTALEEAYNELLAVDAQRKHVILLTDGQSATHYGYEQLATNMVANHMTLSTVAIGAGADQSLLNYLAHLANGRYYFTNDQSTIPAIFSREAVMVARTYIVDQPFVPGIGQAGNWRSLFMESLPEIQAYIATTAKETAEVILMSPEPDPLLARWQYGAGRSVAWTSDLSGKWSGSWVQWESFPQIFTEIIKWTFPQFHSTPLQLRSQIVGDQVKIEVKTHDSAFQGELRAVFSNEQLQQKEVMLTPTVPGEYEAMLDITNPGVYLTRIDMRDPARGEEEWVGNITTGFVIPYSPEYRISSSFQEDRIIQLAEMTGGRILSFDRPEEVFAGDVQAKRTYYDMQYVLILIALLIWLLDIANRRFTLSWRTIASFRSANWKTATKSSSNQAVHTLKRLSQRKQQSSTPKSAITRQEQPMVDWSQHDREPEKPSPPENENRSESAMDDRMNRLLAAKKRGSR